MVVGGEGEARLWHGSQRVGGKERWKQRLVETGCSPLPVDAKSLGLVPWPGEEAAADLSSGWGPGESGGLGACCRPPVGHLRTGRQLLPGDLEHLAEAMTTGSQPSTALPRPFPWDRAQALRAPSPSRTATHK